MAMSSKFYKDISKVERKVWGVSWRQLKAYLMFLGIAGLMIAEIFLLPDWAFILFSVPSAMILGSYPLFLLLDTWKQKKRKFELRFYYEERTFQTGQIRRYRAHEFTQKKNVNETDTI